MRGYSSATVQSAQCQTKADIIGNAQGSNRQLIATSSLHTPVGPQRAQTTGVEVEMHRPEPNGSKTSMYPRQSLAPPRVSAVGQVRQRGPHHVDHGHAASRILSLKSQKATSRIVRRSSTDRLQRHKKLLQATRDTSKGMMPDLKNAHLRIQTMNVDDSESQEEDMNDIKQHKESNKHNTSQRISNSNLDVSPNRSSDKALIHKNHNGLKRKRLKEMMLDVHTAITPYTDHYLEPEHFAPLFLSSRVVNTPGRYGYVYYACKSCNKEIVSRNNFKHHHRTLYHLQNMKDWIRKLIQNNYVDQIHYRTRKIAVALVKKAQEAIVEHLHELNLVKAKFHMKCNEQLDITQPPEDSDAMEVIHTSHQDGTWMINPPKQIDELDFAAYSRTSQAIIHRCPPKFALFRTRMLKLLSNIYSDRNTNNLQLQFSIKFYGAKRPHRHWILE